MQDSRYKQIEIEDKGSYSLVPTQELIALLGAQSKSNILRLPCPEILTFGYLLLIFRTSRKLTFNQLATDSKVKLRTLKNFENKGTKPQKANLDKLCNFFGEEFELQLPLEVRELRK